MIVSHTITSCDFRLILELNYEPELFQNEQIIYDVFNSEFKSLAFVFVLIDNKIQHKLNL